MIKIFRHTVYVFHIRWHNSIPNLSYEFVQINNEILFCLMILIIFLSGRCPNAQKQLTYAPHRMWHILDGSLNALIAVKSLGCTFPKISVTFLKSVDHILRASYEFLSIFYHKLRASDKILKNAHCT